MSSIAIKLNKNLRLLSILNNTIVPKNGQHTSQIRFSSKGEKKSGEQTPPQKKNVGDQGSQTLGKDSDKRSSKTKSDSQQGQQKIVNTNDIPKDKTTKPKPKPSK